jgi:4-amino-4-deoxy-L-arabinose transferase-like glycosyltransferase
VTVSNTTIERPLYIPPDAPGALSVALHRLSSVWAIRLVHRHSTLLWILLVQAVLTLRVSNSAFQDEALYLFAGHREIALLLHGTPTFDNYASYFSGAPFLYPVLGAAVDGVAGLAGARFLSLLLMVATTALLYGLTRRLFDAQVAFIAAVLFAVAEPTQFMGHLATFDAPALFLLALACWLVVRLAHRHPAAVLVGAPLLILAAATKYAALLFVPTVIALSVLTAVRYRGWRPALLRGALLAVASAGLSLAALAVAPQLWLGIRTTTSARAAGTDSTLALLTDTGRYVGGAFVLAVIGTVLYRRREQPSTWPPTSRRERLLLGVVLTGTALLAPIDQIHLHTLTSLHKHVGYGLLFAAPMAGLALSRLLHAHDPRRLGAVLVACVLLTWAGSDQAATRFHDWPNSRGLVAALRTQVRPATGRYLVEEDEVPRYYLRGLTQPYQWFGTYFFRYTDRHGTPLTGIPAYRAAIADRYFDVIALRYGPTAPLDVQIDGQLKAQQGYRLVATVPAASSYGAGAWSIWRVSP